MQRGVMKVGPIYERKCDSNALVVSMVEAGRDI